MIALILRGPPMTRHEPHHQGQGKSFPDKRTVVGVSVWRDEWERKGAPYIAGPVTLRVLVECRRPKTHYRADGETLSSVGLRSLIPRRPDVDNVLKLVLDALKGHAFGDDALVAHVDVAKAYTGHAQTTVTIRPHLTNEWRGFEWERDEALKATNARRTTDEYAAARASDA